MFELVNYNINQVIRVCSTVFYASILVVLLWWAGLVVLWSGRSKTARCWTKLLLLVTEGRFIPDYCIVRIDIDLSSNQYRAIPHLYTIKHRAIYIPHLAIYHQTQGNIHTSPIHHQTQGNIHTSPSYIPSNTGQYTYLTYTPSNTGQYTYLTYTPSNTGQYTYLTYIQSNTGQYTLFTYTPLTQVNIYSSLIHH